MRRVRWGLMWLLSASIAINLIDRQALSVVAPRLLRQLSLSDTQYSYILVAFQLGMIVGQLPAGIFLDWIGTRLGFAIIFVAWSVINGLHAFALNLWDLITLRFLLGAAECGNYSGGIKAIVEWMPAESRGLAAGVFNGGAQIGSLLAPPVIVLITIQWGWRSGFLLPSLLGLLWLAPWLWLASRLRLGAATPETDRSGTPLLDTPLSNRDRSRWLLRRSVARWQEKPAGAQDSSELTPAAGLTWSLLRQRPVVGFMLYRAFTGPLTSFYWYWLPLYLLQARGMSFLQIGSLAWVPFAAGGAGNLLGGAFSDFLLRSGFTPDRGLKPAFLIGGLLAMSSLLVPCISNNALALATICIAIFGNQWMQPIYIGCVGEMFPASVVARVSGIGGLADSTMTMLAMLFTGIIVERSSFAPVLLIAGSFPALALASIYLGVGPIMPLKMHSPR